MKFTMYFARIISGILIYLTISTPLTFAQKDRSGIYIDAGSGLDYTIVVALTDSQGRRAGLLSVPLNIGSGHLTGSVKEIPNSSVGYDAIDDHITGEKQPGTLAININRPIEGQYFLEITGTVLTTYRIGIFTSDRELNSIKLKFKGVTDQGIRSTYQITYSSTPGVPTTAVRVATFSSANQDVELSFKIDWIKNVGLKNSLIKKLQNAEADQSRGDIIAAKNTLNAFINEVKAQTGKGIDSDAATMLEQDAQYLIEHL